VELRLVTIRDLRRRRIASRPRLQKCNLRVMLASPA